MKLKPTREQQLIINHRRGHAMVKAGPGCAKTSTLALRVKYMLDRGCDPSSIVILTYGKALTLDITRTLFQLLGPRANQITVLTIHSFAYRLVRKGYQLLEYGEVPTFAKPQWKKRFIKREAKRTGLTQRELKQAFAHYNQDNYAKVEAALGKDKAAMAKKAYNQYSGYKRKNNTVDYRDMIRGALELIKHQSVSILWPYQHLMVDELQDIDGLQKEFLLHLSLRMESTVMVGDPQQSIYGWRGSLLRYWTDLDKALLPKQFVLTQTFRVPRQALPLVNNLGCRIDVGAPVLTSQFEGEIPTLLDFVDQDQQHCFMAKEIKRLITSGVDLNQIAILGKTKKELGQTALALRARQIPTTERYAPTNTNRHKAHLLAIIRLTRLEQLRIGRSSKLINSEEQALARTYMENLWLDKKTIQQLQERLKIKPRAILSVKSDSKDYSRINDLSRALKKAAGLHVESAVQCLIDASKPTLKDRSDRHHKLLLRDLSEIKIKSRNCKTLMDIEDKWFEPSMVDKDKGVQVMTCHGAKGQEWDYVFIINVVQGVFPRYQVTTRAREEEHRVFYVVVTRHHKKLYLLQTPTPVRIVGKKSGSIKPVIFDERSSFIDIDKQGLFTKSTTKWW